MKTDWKAGQIGDVCTVIAGQSPKGSAYNDQGVGLPFYQGKKEFRDRHIGPPTTWTSVVTKEGEPGDILMSVRAPVGPINEATQRICIGRGLAAIRAKDGLDRDFLWYALLWLQPTIKGSAGAVFDSINKAGIESLPIPLPALEEQQRIVAVLDEAFEGLARARAHAEANLQNARELFESAIEAALERAGGEPVTLQEMMDTGMITGHLDGNHGSDYPRKAEFVSEGVPYISANCIGDNEIDFGRCKYLTLERASGLRKGVAKNRDVLFAHNATVGPVTLLKTEEEKVILSTSLTYYRCNEEELIPEFLVCEMRSSGFRRQYEAVMAQATRNQVPITMQRTFTHMIPPLAEQRRIAELGVELEVKCNSAIKAYEASLNDFDDLRQSLLQKAFAGELT